MKQYLKTLWSAIIGRAVILDCRALALLERAAILATLLPRLDPLDAKVEPESEKPETMTPIKKLTLAVAYLATLPALFAKTKKALQDALDAASVPGDTRRQLEAAKAELAEKTAELDAFNALAEQAGAAVDAADAADDALPGADEGEVTGDGSGEPLPPIVDGTEIPPGGDLLPPDEPPADPPAVPPVDPPTGNPAPVDPAPAEG